MIVPSQFSHVSTSATHHPAAAGSVFYTLPLEFLTSLSAGLNSPDFGPDLWKVELELSRLNGEHSQRIGFINGQPIVSSMLVDPDFSTGVAEYLKAANLSQSAYQEADRQATQARRNQRAYCGWLMTSREFITEHTTVWNLVRPMAIADSSIPSPVATGFRLDVPGAHADENNAVTGDVLHTLRDHCAKWRLSRLAGPFMPDPLGLQSPAPLPLMAAEQAIASGSGLTVLPDTMPLPPKEELRKSIDGARQSEGDAHLDGWKNVIASGSRNKRGELDRYARLFAAQHLYSVLMSRHSEALDGRKGYVCERIADFFHVDERTIVRDFDELAQKLGSQWWKRAY